jgi:N-acetylglucosaminyldiphosphoundecaprenol N-acetyl-beta-D-mannosaminyltransferase
MMLVDKKNVLGVGVSPLNYAGACDAITSSAMARQPLTVTALAVHGVMTGALDAQHRARLNTLDVVLPDGQPVRWALNWLFATRLADRVYGPTLMLEVCARAEHMGLIVGLYGNKADVLDELTANLKQRFPRLRLGAKIPSRFGRVAEDEQAAIADQIISSGTEILFIGIGCPRQEVWLYEHRARLPLPMIAVGAAFDFHANRLAQAPTWMQRRGLEWLFRLRAEPRRLWRRYVLLNPGFLTLLALQWLGLWRIKPTASADLVPFEGYA